MDDAQSVVFHDVVVTGQEAPRTSAEAPPLLCRIRGAVVELPPWYLLPGSTVERAGDVGTVVISREHAAALGLV